MGGMGEALIARTIHIAGHGGDDIEAYQAVPLADDAGPAGEGSAGGPGSHGGVVVIHHMPGYDEATREITRRFAAHGYAAICPNLYWREAPGASTEDAAATVRAAGGVPDERLVGDVAAAAAHLRGLDGSNGKVGVIGYCSGGRQSFLAACSLDLDAAVDCYGAFVVGQPPEGTPMRGPLTHLAADLSCPLLGLFGAEDTHPSPADNAELERILTDHGKTFDFHTYDNAGHAFFSVDRPSYRQAAAVDGWQQIWRWFGRYLT
jgi:carboxymethylenebutenolidase